MFIDPGRVAALRRPLASVVLHEFLHLAGRTHPTAKQCRQSIMNPQAPVRPPNFLYPLDVAILQTLYGTPE